MRTHLLHAVAVTGSEAATDIGDAANDNRYGASIVLASSAAAPGNTTSSNNATENDDRYYLGGYAGI